MKHDPVDCMLYKVFLTVGQTKVQFIQPSKLRVEQKKCIPIILNIMSRLSEL